MNTFSQHELPNGNSIRMGFVPDNLRMTQEQFEVLCELQPVEPQQIRMSGRMIDILRRHQAFGRNYQFSGQTAVAAPTHELLEPYLQWAQGAVYNRLNGLMLNWYSGGLRHYIRPHSVIHGHRQKTHFTCDQFKYTSGICHPILRRSGRCDRSSFELHGKLLRSVSPELVLISRRRVWRVGPNRQMFPRI